MNRILQVLILTIGLFFNANSQILEPVKWEYESKKIEENKYEVIFTAKIDEGWKLYGLEIPEGGPVATSFSIQSSDNYKLIGDLKAVIEPEVKFDKTFEIEVQSYHKQAKFSQVVELKKESAMFKAVVEFMSCDDARCLPPSEHEFEIQLGETKPKTAVTESENAKDDSSLWTLFFFSFLAGLAAILTPCVFPMIPMTVTFFMHSDKNKFLAKAKALTYGGSIIAIYTIIGTIVAVTLGATFANWLSTHWLPNILFFLIFMIFAASFFGMFEIQMPSWIINKSVKNEDKGGFLGPIFMAFTLVLVSFSCTGPLVGAILVASAGGEVIMPIVGMFGFSLAFALPFTLFAFFPSWLKGLPKSGGWLNSVKVFLGFIELALGLKFLSVADQTYHWGLLDREIYLAVWIVIFTLLGFYLLGKLKFSHDSDLKFVSVPRLILAILSFSFVVYLTPGMFGAPLKALSGYLPPMKNHDFNFNKIIRENSGNSNVASFKLSDEKIKYAEFFELPHGLTGYFDIEQAKAASAKEGKPLFIDFTGHGCVNCREMEANVWSDPRVLKLLREEYIIVALYVDDKKELPENDWIVSNYDGKTKKTIGKINANYQIEKYQVNAQPYYVLTDENDKTLTKPKAYDTNVENFIEFLKSGIEAYKKVKE